MRTRKPLRNFTNPTVTLIAAAVLGLLCGCATGTRDVNPAVPRVGRGYVDLYTQPKTDVWWKVDVFDAQRQGYKEFTAQFESPALGVFRVEARPGRHKARISFVNRSIEAPAEIEVEVREAMITPIRVTLEPGGTSYVRTVEDRGTAVVRNKITDQEQRLWKISASAEPPVPYVSKDNAPYAK